MKKDGRRRIKTRISIKDFIRRMSRSYLLMFLLLPILFIYLIYMNFRYNYRTTSENIEYKAEATLAQYSIEMDGFLEPYVKLMEYIAYNIEDMYKTDTGNDVILSYITRESDYIKDRQKFYTTGVYGSFRNEYLDGDGWVPDPGYDPKERPWYIDAKNNPGSFTYVKPYIDSMTGDRIMTISKLLSDGDSVVAIDIRMDNLQDITELLAVQDKDTDYVIVMDSRGNIITHSDPMMIGRNFLASEEGPDREIAEKLLNEGLTEFTVDRNGAKEIIYSHMLGGGWYVLAVMNQSRTFSGLYRAVTDSLLIGLFGTFLIFFLLYSMAKKRMEAENYIINLNAVSGIYVCVYKIELEEDTFEEISCVSDRLTDLIGDRHMNANNLMKRISTLRSDERNRKDLMEFINLKTLGDRMKDSYTITQEFMNVDKLWNRARFIAAERYPDGRLKSVLFTVEMIDKEKRARDRLIYISEIDRMTGINNRGSGENKVRNSLLSGDGGMFMLLDVDRFKSINDTYGHNVGDKVLIAIADCMKKAFRNNDIVMRLGGDEFAAFAPLVLSREGGEIIVNRFMKRIEKLEIPELEEKKIEVSIGVAFYEPTDQFTFDELYKMADKCAYESKKQNGSFATYYDKGLDPGETA